MITILPESHKSTIGLKIEGKLTHKAYKAIIPTLEQAIQQYGSIQLLLEMHNFKGWQIKAAFDDLIFAFKNRRKIDRVAILCDGSKDVWTSLIDQPFAKGTKGREKYFKIHDKKTAWNWLNHHQTSTQNLAVDASIIDNISLKNHPESAPDCRFCLIIGQSPLRFFAAGILNHWKVLKGVDFAVMQAAHDITYPDELTVNLDVIQILKRLNWFSLLMRSKALTPSNPNTMILKVSLFEKIITKELELDKARIKLLTHISNDSIGWKAQFQKHSMKYYKNVFSMSQDLKLNPSTQEEALSDDFSTQVINLWDAIHVALRQS